jgi:hypothetical protein
MKATLIGAVCLLGALITAGCDDCSPPEAECDGDTLRVCSRPDGDGPFITASWSETKCDIACRQFGGEARCVHTTEPVATCGRSGLADDRCIDGVPADCWHGYAFPRSACGTGTVCVATPACGVMCLASDVPEPRCDTANWFCDGNSIATCTCGVVSGRRDCGAGVCQQVGGEVACTFSSAPDPRCGDPAQPSSGYCSDGIAHECWRGFVIFTYDCKSAPCVERPGAAPTCPQAKAGPAAN